LNDPAPTLLLHVLILSCDVVGGSSKLGFNVSGSSGVAAGASAAVGRCVHVVNLRLSLIFVLLQRFSSRICILSSLIAVSVSVPRRLHSFVSVVPKMLKSRSHEAELAQTKRMRRARRMKVEACDQQCRNLRIHSEGLGFHSGCKRV